MMATPDFRLTYARDADIEAIIHIAEAARFATSTNEITFPDDACAAKMEWLRLLLHQEHRWPQTKLVPMWKLTRNAENEVIGETIVGWLLCRRPDMPGDYVSPPEVSQGPSLYAHQGQADELESEFGRVEAEQLGDRARHDY